MEPLEKQVDEPFGRQPKPVTVTIVGAYEDAVYYMQLLRRYAESHGDNAERLSDFAFRIYPRAVND